MDAEPEPNRELVKCQCGHSKFDHYTEDGRTVCRACLALALHRFAEQEPLEADIIIDEL